MRVNKTKSLLGIAITVAAAMLASGAPIDAIAASVGSESALSITIPAGDLNAALKTLAKQTGAQLLYDRRTVEGAKTPGVTAARSAQEALTALLNGTGFTFHTDESGAMFIQSREGVKGVNDTPADQMRLAVLGDKEKSSSAKSEGSSESDRNQVVVEDKRIKPFTGGNVDQPRSVNDAQPYYVWDAEAIKRSGAIDVADFLKTRLTMDTTSILSRQRKTDSLEFHEGNTTNIALRGLNADETLVLINGRRAAPINRAYGTALFGLNTSNNSGQADLNGIPLASIDRIEVLPTSAAGIYGGSAVGGVINVILRRDYVGGEVAATYGNVFDSDAPNRQLDATFGMALEGGKSHLMLTGGYSDSSVLRFGDRQSITRKYLDQMQDNYPDLKSVFLFYGASTNVQAGETLTLKGSNVSLGSSLTYIPSGYAGVAIDGTAPLLSNAGQQNMEFPATAQLPTGLNAPLGSEPVVKSVSGNIRRQMSERLEMFVDGAYSVNALEGLVPGLNNAQFGVPASSPFNPFNEEVYINLVDPSMLPFSHKTTSRRLSTGFVLKLPRGWQAQGDYSWSDNRSVSVNRLYNIIRPISLGLINPFVDWVAHPQDLSPYLMDNRSGDLSSYMQEVALRGAGTAWSWSWGDVTLALSAQQTKSGLKEGRSITGPEPYAVQPYVIGETIYSPKSNVAQSLYAELNIPLVTAKNSMPLLRQLDVQVAVRRDGYRVDTSTSDRYFIDGVSSPYNPPLSANSAKYSSMNPTFGLRWRPLQDVMLRASIAGGFRPPSYLMLLDNPLTGSDFISDPRRGFEFNFVPTRFGGSPDIKPELSDALSVGLVFEPRMLKDLRLSIDYNRIRKTDVFAALTGADLMADEDLFADRIVRAPKNPNDPWPVGRVTQLDLRAINAYRADTESYDLSVNYRIDAGAAGNFEFYGLGTWLRHVRQQFTRAGAIREQIGRPGGYILEYKANAGLNWEKGAWSLGWVARYTPEYPLQSFYAQLQGSAEVPRQLYHDAVATYRFGAQMPGAAWYVEMLDKVDVQVNIRNVLDKEPPLDAFYFSNSPFGDVRLREYSVSIRKQFN